MPINFLFKEKSRVGNGYFYETPLRQYDPVLGRFGGVDLLAEEYATMSPYTYAANNPILFSDPTGARPAPISCDGCHSSGLDGRAMGRVSINTLAGSYTTSSGATYGGGGYTSTYGTGNDRMDAMYGQAKAEQALQTLAQAWGGSYSNGSITISGSNHVPSMPQLGTYDWSYSIPVAISGEDIDNISSEEFFDITGKVDVAVNSLIAIGKEGFDVAIKQTSKSSYYTAAAKNTSKIVVNNLKRAGLVGVAAGTLLSGVELYIDGGSAKGWAKFGTGIAITAVGFIPGIGLPAAIILGSIEAEGGFDSFYDSFGE